MRAYRYTGRPFSPAVGSLKIGSYRFYFSVNRKTKDATETDSRKTTKPNHTSTRDVFNHIAFIVSHRLVLGWLYRWSEGSYCVGHTAMDVSTVRCWGGCTGDPRRFRIGISWPLRYLLVFGVINRRQAQVGRKKKRTMETTKRETSVGITTPTPDGAKLAKRNHRGPRA